MHRNVTAVYRTREVAELVRRGLQDIGISASDIHIIPDPAHDTPSGRAAEGGDRTTTGTGTGAAPRGTTIAAQDDRGVSGTGAPPAHPTPGHDHPLQGTGGLGRGGDDRRHTDRLHDLHLPEEDLKTYQHFVRRGDYVVSAEVDKDHLEKVQAIMRRPEAEVRDIEHHSSEFRNEPLIGHSAGEGYRSKESHRARRLTTASDDRYARTYERDQRLGGLRM